VDLVSSANAQRLILTEHIFFWKFCVSFSARRAASKWLFASEDGQWDLVPLANAQQPPSH